MSLRLSRPDPRKKTQLSEAVPEDDGFRGGLMFFGSMSRCPTVSGTPRSFLLSLARGGQLLSFIGMIVIGKVTYGVGSFVCHGGSIY